MLRRLQTMWRDWRERGLQYRIERALYKAGGGRDVRHGGTQGGAVKRSDDLGDITGNPGAGPSIGGSG